MKIVISGCGVAGPTLAYWLKRYGFDPVLIEKAPAPRRGGYVIDFWGPGYEVAELMGLIPAFQRDGYNIERLRTVTSSGRTTTLVGMSQFSEMTGGKYLSIARSDVARNVLEVCQPVDVRFGVEIERIEEQDGGLSLRLSDGTIEKCDLLIGADGLHSNVRNLTFGPEDRFERRAGFHVAAFTLDGYRPREDGTYVMYTRPKKQVTRVSIRDDRTLFLFVFNDDLLERREGAGPIDQLRAIYRDAGWEVDAILARLDEADDLYFDTVSQIRMPAWSKGRVALLGDAAACISLLGGEGTGLAMTEAHVLAGELARANGHYEQAFRAYQERMMPLLTAKQENALRFTTFFAPDNWISLLTRDLLNLLVSVPVLGRWMLQRSFTSDFELPDYSQFERQRP